MKPNYSRVIFLFCNLLIFSGFLKSQIINQNFAYSGAIQTFTVPTCITQLTIQARGAEGGWNPSSTFVPGRGADIRGVVAVTPGQVLKLLIGQSPVAIAGNGGGGGSYVTTAANVPLIIAGGGGGSGTDVDSPNKHGQAGTTGGTGSGGNGGGTGGTAGSGGNIGTFASDFKSGAGGGLLSNGVNGFTGGTGGNSFVSGGAATSINAVGGFGGGGSGSGFIVGAGGGGYSGGGSGSYDAGLGGGVGGGGGSFNAGTNQVNVSGSNFGNGSIIISYCLNCMNLAVSSASCVPGTTANVVVTEGSAPFTYAWAPSALTSSAVTGLTPGTYTLTVTDAGACRTASTTVRIASSLSLTAFSGCAPTGTASATVAGGTAPYTYTWSGSAITTSLATGLSAGIRTVTVSDFNGCQTRTGTVNITNTLVLTAGSGSCIPTGTANAIVTGGIPPYTYTWSPSAQTTSLATGLPSGSQTVTVSDVGACQTRTAVVSITGSLNIVSISSASCIPSGSAAVTATGGVAPYTYTWSGSAQTTSLATGLTAGTKTVTVSDVSGCQTRTGTLNIAGTMVLTASSGSCIPTGTANANVTGGIPPYTYTWSPSAQTGSLAIGLPAGSQTVRVSDAGACQTRTAVVSITGSLNIVSIISASCIPSGSAAVTATGGVAPYTYTWSGSAQTTSLATGLTAGTKTVTVSDVNGCQTRTGTLNIAGTMVLTASSGSCIPTGTANAIVTGGNPPYSYTWSPSAQTGSLATGLPAGSQTVTVSDVGACQTRTAAVNVTGTLNIVSVSNTSCTPTGSASITSTGGVAPYTYVWSGTAQTTSLVTGLSVGIYTVTVRDVNLCQIRSTTVNITSPSTIVVTNTALCIGYTTTMTAVGSLGTGGTYTWTGPNILTPTPHSATVTANPTVTTIYTIASTNSLNCTSTTTAQLFVVFTQTVPIANPTTCLGQTIALLSNAIYTGAINNWTGPGGYLAFGIANPTIAPATLTMSGGYSLTTISAPGCTSSAVSNVTVFGLPSPTIVSNGTVCTGVNLILNGSGGTTYTWTAPPTSTFSSVTQNTFVANTTTLNSGPYTLTTAFANGCRASVTRTLLVRPLPTPNFTVNANNPVCRNSNVVFSGSGGAPYTWRGPNAFLSFVQNPTIFNIQPGGSGNYTLTATLNTCTNSIVQSVTVNALPVPTATNNSPICAGIPLQLGGTAGISYTWTGPASYSSAQQFASIASSSLANNGNYTVTVSDVNACRNTAVTTVTILPAPVLALTGTNVCFNEPGSFTLTGGTAWNWSGPGVTTTNNAVQNFSLTNVDNTTAGIYTVVAGAANSCSTTALATLSFVPLPVLALTNVTVCDQAQATLSVTGASSYTWTGPQSFLSTQQNAIVPIANGPVLGNLGIYTVIARGVNSCTNTSQITLTTIPIPTITAIADATVCLNTPAQLTATINPANVGFNWTAPGYTSTAAVAQITAANSPAPVVYTLVVTAVNGCTQAATATLSTRALPVIAASGTLICKNEPYSLVASGAGANGVYSWNGPTGVAPGATVNIPNVNAATVGTYVAVGTDSFSCVNSLTVSVDTLSLPNVIASGNTVCFGSPAVLTASGAIAYVWSGPNGFTLNSPVVNIPAVTSSLTQTYSVVGVAPNTCTNITTVLLATTPLPIPNITAPARVCFRTNLNMQGAGAKTYTWTGPYEYVATQKDVVLPLFNMQQQGTYTLTARDSLGCVNSTTASVKIDPLPGGVLQSNNTNNNCVPFCAEYKLKSTGASPIVSTSWLSNNDRFSGETFTICVSKAANNGVVGSFTDAIGCTNTMSFVLLTNPTPVADFYYTPEKPLENGDEVLFNDLSKGDQLSKWTWSFGNSGAGSNLQNTSFLFENAGTYPVVLIVRNTWGCADTIIKNITVNSDFKLFVPNSFTPNGDGVNDTFQPKGRGVAKYSLWVYNRWGSIIFKTEDFEKGWDGLVSGSSSSDDVFTWRITTVDVLGKSKEFTGYVTLSR